MGTYCQTIKSVGGGGDTTDGTKHADGDFALGCNQFREAGEGRRNDCGILRGDLLV